MAQTKISKRTGRPPLDIDEKVVEDMALDGNAIAHIADYFGCDESTIRKRISCFGH